MKKFTLLLALAMFSLASFATDYKKVTSAPTDWSGEYLLVYEKSATEVLVWTGVDAGQCHQDLTQSEGIISTTKATEEVTITIAPIADGGYSLLVNSGTNAGKYMGVTSYSNGLKFNADAIAHTITLEETGVQMVITTSGGNMTMRYNANSGTNNERFRYYKNNGQQPVLLYKKVAGEEIAATGIALSETSVSLAQYKRATLTATLTPAEATTAIIWVSSDETIVTVTKGELTAVGIGSATITATAGEGVSATCEVTVTSTSVLTCAEAAEIALAVSNNNVVAEGGMYVIRGYVTEVFNNAESNFADYGNYSFWMADSKDGENVFEAYQVAPIDGKYLAAVGDYVEIVGDLTKYDTTPETTGKGTSTVKKLQDPATGIDNTTVGQKTVKAIEDGQLVIIREGVKYNAMGVRLQ